MAGGNNKSFKTNPQAFLNEHFLMINVNGQREAKLPDVPGIMNIDLVVGPEPGWIRLENYDYNKSRHGYGAEPVEAFYLPAKMNTSTYGDLTSRCDYMFTADLSGCLFAVGYNPNGSVIVEHYNAAHGAGDRGSIIDHAREIINTQGPDNSFYKILSPCAIPGADNVHVKLYTSQSCVIGVRTGGRWRFYYKLYKDAAQREL